MRIERVGLKHHRKAALCRRNLGGVLSVDANLAVRYIFQACDQPKQCGFATARRTDKYGEFAIFDCQVQRRDDFDLSETLGHLVKYDTSHV